MEEDLTTTMVRRNDLKFLHSIQKKKRLTAVWAVVERMVQIIKLHKMEEEI